MGEDMSKINFQKLIGYEKVDKRVKLSLDSNIFLFSEKKFKNHLFSILISSYNIIRHFHYLCKYMARKFRQQMTRKNSPPNNGSRRREKRKTARLKKA